MDTSHLNHAGAQRFRRLADFLFEAGMLRKTPRSGYQFLGSGCENVAEHSFRTAIIGYVLAKEAGADIARTTLLCLFHDFAEARTGDFNYVNRIYNKTDVKAALKDASSGTGLSDDLEGFWNELEAEASLEARLAHDADQLDLILNLKEELDLGNQYAGKWLENSLKRLVTKEGITLAKAVVETDHTDWWYLAQSKDWWVKGRKN